MTHFVIGIIVPKKIMEMGEDSVRFYINEVMEPYSESYETEPHIAISKEDIKKEFEEFKKKVKTKIKKKEKVEDWEKKGLKQSLKAWVKTYHGYTLDKKGNALSSFNEKSFYDYYCVGGRWSGILKIPENDNEKLLQQIEDQEDREDESIEGNSAKISLLLDKFKTRNEKNKILEEGRKQIIDCLDNSLWNGFGWADILRKFVKHDNLTKDENELYDKVRARVKEFIQEFQFENPYILGKVIDPSGEVYQGVSYGWFGTSKDIVNQNVWAEEYIRLLEKHKDDYMVSLDCHV